ncbi:hypothetical protein IWQ60_003018 [Tieghemiomyces parasiticus]|uniref:Ubiquitin carboxyl-terminal hydrolase n=1 Tax=Tieghemiomyces parasiticus TaxID=78921 RepID=A0A9W8AE34_9FUNG|nr:hypothetical protein IWQ60_003018 [Tieghemiomyces parasiticus]
MSQYALDDLEVEELSMHLPWCSAEVPPDYWSKPRKSAIVQPTSKLATESTPVAEAKPELETVQPAEDTILTNGHASVSAPEPSTAPVVAEETLKPQPTAPATAAPSVATATDSASKTPAEAKSPVPTPAGPPKSWADMLRSQKSVPIPVAPANATSSTPGAPASTPAPGTNVTSPSPAATRATASPKRPNATATVATTPPATFPNGSARFQSVGETLANYQVTYARTPLQPRGLVNNGNMCFMNSILQSLVHCPPFYNLLKKVETQSAHSFHSTTPLSDALVAFVNEFREARPLDAPDHTGEPLLPENVYNSLRSLKKFDSLKGRQEDAQEFMGFLLDGLHEEFRSLVKAYRTAQPSAVDESEAGSREKYSWMEVGKNNRVAVTQTVATAESPITQIFGGRLRSVLKAAGSKDSITFEPFESLLLDISPSEVKSVEDALQRLVEPETLEGFTNAGGQTVAATKQLLLEAPLPPVLILHINRFVYTSAGGAQKLQKPIEYGHQLLLPPTLFSAAQRPRGPIRYDLSAVVYHHGRHLTGGHYTCDIMQAPESWLNIDDTKIERISPAEVITQGYDDRLPYVLFYVKHQA